MNVLFVSSRNLCRSPVAAALVKRLARSDRLVVGSAGLEPQTAGDPAHPLMVAVARAHGIALDAHCARMIQPRDYRTAHLVVCMDRSDLRIASDLYQLSAPSRARGRSKFRLFGGFLGADVPADIPDPHLGSQEKFEQTFELIERCAFGFVSDLIEQTMSSEPA